MRGLGSRVQGFGFRVQGLGFRVQGFWTLGLDGFASLQAIFIQ